MKKELMALSDSELQELQEALCYLKMGELKKVCQQYDLAEKGHKDALIHRIMTFVKTGVIEPISVIPEVSKAQKGSTYPLLVKTKMLHGAYKNDAKTRAFFKKLLGDHFHFTAFGVDWLNEQWLAGTPPTYGEFAKFWQKEYKRRRQEKVAPKKEWAYINFTQSFLRTHPHASGKEVIQAWNKERHKMVEKAKKLLPE